MTLSRARTTAKALVSGGAIATLAAAYSAQERPVVIGSEPAGLRLAGTGPEQSLTQGRGFRLAERSEIEVDLSSLTGAIAHEAGPFDLQRYGFSTVHVYFDRTLPPPDLRDVGSSNATLRLIVATS